MSQTKDNDHGGASPVLVALTASAAKTGSLEALLGLLPSREDTALVAVLQHREALDEDRFRRALAGAGHELVELADGAPVEPGRVYLPAAAVIVTVEDGHFATHPTEQVPGSRGVIDSFLVSLAQAWGERAIVVTLDGTDGDGTLGVKEVKGASGLVLAEATAGSKAGTLASSDEPAALADAVLPVEEIAPRLLALIEQIQEGPDPKGPAPDSPETREALATIAGILRTRLSHDFHGYKRGTFLRRVRRRMQALTLDDLPAYIEALRASPSEAQDLFNDLLIGVTEFFRDRREWEYLEREVIPIIFEGKGPRDPVRVWVVGCSTGEEAYSLAILLAEQRARLDDPPLIQIFASDLDGRALAAARSGRYTESIAKQMTPERLGRWFVKEGNTYCVTKVLRDMCTFSQHSLIKDAPFSRIDLVSCRNLLIYLDAELQERVIPLFHFALKPGGHLFLGTSENTSRHQNLFAPVQPRSRIFRRLDIATRMLPDFPFSTVDRRLLTQGAHLPPTEPARADAADLTRWAERVMEQHSPAYVIIDAQHNVLHFSGNMGPFLAPSRGAASLNLLQLIHPALRLDLRTALARAAEEERTAELHGLELGTNPHRLAVDLVVEPRLAASGLPTGFLVAFKDRGPRPVAAGLSPALPTSDAAEHIRRLEDELRLTRDRLQGTVEELESTNEELKSSNEEYQSLNEELQSANEELETSKEELQSVNEELTTVNGELAHRVHELGHANSDLKNFLESTQIATLFLDNDLRVTNFTPAAVELFHLIESDHGRPITHIKSRVLYHELEGDARRVLRTLAPVEREVGDPETGGRFAVRVLPYRSTDNVIAGVVVTFMDVTARRQAEERLKESEERFRAIVETATDYAIFTTDPEGRIETWPRGAQEVFGWTVEEAVRQPVDMTFTPEDREERVPEKERQEAREQGHALNVRWHLRKDGTRIFIEGSSRPLTASDGSVTGFLKVGQDVTERRATEEALRESEERLKVLVAELQHRTRNLMGVVRSVTDKTLSTSTSLEDFQGRMRDRLNALARVNGLLSRLHEGDRISFDELIRTELMGHGVIGANEQGTQVRLKGPEGIRLRSSTVQTLALGLHELATNALKYGALSRPEGRLEVDWDLADGKDGERRLRVDWRESGVPIPAAARVNGPNGEAHAPARRGYGRELIERALPYQLKAETSYDLTPEGVRCTITLPISTTVGGTALALEGPDA